MASARLTGAAFIVTLALLTGNAATARDVIWSGSSSSLWDTSTTNWLQRNGNSGQFHPGPVSFTAGDNVIFQDTIPGTTKPVTKFSITIQSIPAAGAINFTNSSINYDFSGSLLSGSSLNKTGSGTVTLSNATSISGVTTVSAGTLKVGGSFTSTGGVQVNNNGSVLALSTSNVISNSTNITLGGGTLRTDGFQEGSATSAGLGALTLTASSALDFSSTNGLLHFTSFSTSNTSSLYVYNWDSTDRLYFDNASTLTAAHLGQIQFYSGGTGSTFLGTATFGLDGEMTPVPEPSTILAGVGLVGLIGYRERRRIKSLITREPLTAA